MLTTAEKAGLFSFPPFNDLLLFLLFLLFLLLLHPLLDSVSPHLVSSGDCTDNLISGEGDALEREQAIACGYLAEVYYEGFKDYTNVSRISPDPLMK